METPLFTLGTRYAIPNGRNVDICTYEGPDSQANHWFKAARPGDQDYHLGGNHPLLLSILPAATALVRP